MNRDIFGAIVIACWMPIVMVFGIAMIVTWNWFQCRRLPRPM